MKKVLMMMDFGLISVVVTISLPAEAHSTPPIHPSDAQRYSQLEQDEADLRSKEASNLVDRYFWLDPDEPEGVAEDLFLPDATYVNAGRSFRSVLLRDGWKEGQPKGLARHFVSKTLLHDRWAVIATNIPAPNYRVQNSVMKFHFARDNEGILKIAQIVEIDL